MCAPINKIVKRLESKGFLKVEKKTGTWRFKAIWKFLPLPMKDIVLRYKSILNGYNNYYSFVDNKVLMSKIYWILKVSLRKTLSRKFKLNKYALIQKFGTNFNCNYTNSKGKTMTLNFEAPSFERRPMDFKIGTGILQDPLYGGIWDIRSISNIGRSCTNCGSITNIEMHHLKHIKTINTKLNSFDKMLAKINRKQVALCAICHDKVHNAEYKGVSLKKQK